ncbi:MAG TPA: PfkB family carbohydrate kinase [Roseiflexaceae bacterium]
MTPDYVTCSNLIIDDIVLADGRSFMNTLGGAGTHALVGMRVWSAQLGFIGTVGADFDPQHREILEGLGIDLRGLVERPGYRTARAWQLFEPDERRVEVFRTNEEEFNRLKPQFADIPADYLTAKGFHLQWGTFAELIDLVARLRAVNPPICLVWEPPLTLHTVPPAEIQALLAQIDLFSPDLGEAQALTGERAPERALAMLQEWSTGLVALRMGAQGSFVATAAGERYHVPAVPTIIVDITGAGNAYCGGFLTGLGAGLGVVEAAARAAVSASFALEQFGVPLFTPEKDAEAERRLAWALERIVPYTGALSMSEMSWPGTA